MKNLLLLFISCFILLQGSNLNAETYKDRDKSYLSIDKLKGKVKSSLEFDTTFVINRQTFKIETKYEFVIFTMKLDSILIEADTFERSTIEDIQFLDFNKDGYLDILMLIYEGRNSSDILYLFDSTNKIFKNVNSIKCCQSIYQLESTSKYYYSYQSDMSGWESYLFKIVNFKTIIVGVIFKFIVKEKEVIEIYKIADNNEDKIILVKKLPYHEFISKDGHDIFDFIVKYWNTNYKNFEYY